ncbi:MAG: 5-deoxy-glucuronate isomerase [Armatimonadota bacterium]|nr:5-deoxy-glucuronate isomerase [Armatimonadota bacterium]MDR7518985.1 5-deoxy-glucuronate isomerase [Armatimonadota bacterium]MDR7548896.1 5-deoxy-glucuronate isomerase [Armatimonadota bacterium]
MSGLPESRHLPGVPDRPGYRRVIAAPEAGLKFLEFALVTLTPAGTPVTWESRDREAVVYLIGGVCEFTVSGAAGSLAGVLDSRPSVFDGPPQAVFLPSGSRLGLASPRVGARLAIFSAPPLADRRLRLIGPHDVSVRQVGKETWSRRVTSVVDATVASRLAVGETFNPPGHWSSYPPHKHDAPVPGRETPMEEIYHFFVSPPAGFGLQMVYTPPDAAASFERVYRVRDGDTVVIPRGYHPVVAAGGYRLAYLWAISGDRVDYGAWTDDPAHAWLLR